MVTKLRKKKIIKCYYKNGIKFINYGDGYTHVKFSNNPRIFIRKNIQIITDKQTYNDSIYFYSKRVITAYYKNNVIFSRKKIYYRNLKYKKGKMHLLRDKKQIYKKKVAWKEIKNKSMNVLVKIELPDGRVINFDCKKPSKISKNEFIILLTMKLGYPVSMIFDYLGDIKISFYVRRNKKGGKNGRQSIRTSSRKGSRIRKRRRIYRRKNQKK